MVGSESQHIASSASTIGGRGGPSPTTGVTLPVFRHARGVGITESPEFARKGLAEFAANVGLKCGHDCAYCSAASNVRMHPEFAAINRSAFDGGYAIVDPETPNRVARDARRIRRLGCVQLCTLTDAWAPEAQVHDLGRRCLEAILNEPGWTVRILTKNSAVLRDVDLIDRHRDRVVVGLSLTGLPDAQSAISVLEPHASPITERIEALREAHQRGLRTYGMLCPLLPLIADDPGSVERLVELCLEVGAEEIFAEPVNARGPGLRRCEEALAAAGMTREAEAIGTIRHHAGWSGYTLRLLRTVQQAAATHNCIGRLRFLLYPEHLSPSDLQEVRRDDRGIVWLG